MGSSTWLWMLLVLFSTGLMGSLEAYEFKVGGNQGWVLNPSENYNQWSARMRFQVNDTVFFKYNKGTDSVFVVNKQDYDTCNTQNPIMKMDGGDSVFKFDRSGPFYFISGNKDNCDKGQKLPVVVMAVRNSKKPTPPSTPPPVAQTPATSPTQASPPTKSPATAPSPAGITPATSPTPGSSTGSPSPAPMKSPTPATSPVSPSPATVESPTPATSPATSPVSPSPATVESPTPANTTLSPGMTPAESDTAPNPSSDTATPPPSSTPAFTPPVLLVLLVTLLSSVALGSFVASPSENMDIF
ncbi:early nodulin-like protein 1 isoform X3 [Rhododendron vialii]|uniref:early nodulin-like protein 1 isoform X3 n=1 Tax=Rhododendron vialii TaxID=182163 RepID=UPI00265F28FD|nr:early nodulin-like protein 1 isoform X3 [Rhododendron vialii]